MLAKKAQVFGKQLLALSFTAEVLNSYAGIEQASSIMQDMGGKSNVL